MLGPPSDEARDSRAARASLAFLLFSLQHKSTSGEKGNQSNESIRNIYEQNKKLTVLLVNMYKLRPTKKGAKVGVSVALERQSVDNMV